MFWLSRARQARAFAVAVLLSTASSLAAHAQRAPVDVNDFLSRVIGLSAGDLAALGRREPVTRVLPTRESRDVSVFGAVVVSTPLDAIAAAQSSYPDALRAPGRTLGILRDSISPDDFSGVVLSAKDAHSLERCRVGSCDFKLSVEDMGRALALLHGTDDAAIATGFARSRLADIAAAYRANGAAGMPVYDDYGSGGVRAAVAFDSLVADSPLFRLAPEVREHFAKYPGRPSPGMRDVLYWSRDEISGVRPTTTVNHRVAYAPPDATGMFVTATKQIVADHYLEAALEMVVVIDRGTPDSPESLIMLVREYRFDHMPKAVFVSLRGRVVGTLRERVANDLVRLTRDETRRGTP